MINTQNPIKIFLIGATGYIGGTVLTRLIDPSQAGKWAITALVRTESAAKKLQEVGVTPLIGSLDDNELLTKAATDADVVLNLGHSDHVPGTQALVKGLSTDGSRRKIFIHTSGTGVVMDTSRGDYTLEKVYSDLDVETIHSLPMTQMHRDVDSYIFDHSQDFDAILVAPPTIYGLGSGLFNRQSIQIPTLIRGYIKYGYAAYVGKGLNIWNHVHVEDLADLYLLLLEKALEGKASIGRDGWYFCESGEHYWKDITIKISKELYKQGSIKKPEPVYFKEGEAETYLGEYAWSLVGSNSRIRADRARALGWKPKRESIYDSIEGDVRTILSEVRNSQYEWR